MTTFAANTTLVTAPDPGDHSPIEAMLMDLCNSMHEAREHADVARLAALREQADGLLGSYEATDGEDHPNASWAIPNQRALVLSASGDVSGAIDAEREALPYADTPRRREISLGNLMDRLIRLERYDEAVVSFVEASEVAPNSLPVLLTGAQALYGAGLLSEANALFESIGAIPSLMAPGGELDAYLRYEPRLLEMAPDLPALSDLFAAAMEADHA